METTELVLLKPRARKLPDQVYMAAISLEGSEPSPTAQIIVYSNNVAILKRLVDDHNELVKIRKASKAKK